MPCAIPGDTDDAVRLLTVRELLSEGGAIFIDTNARERIGAPDPLVSHWSRLIDVPLALLMLLLRPLARLRDGGTRDARAVWPLGLFVATNLIVARAAKTPGRTLGDGSRSRSS